MWIRIPFSEYGSGSTKLLNTEPIQIRIHSTLCNVRYLVPTGILERIKKVLLIYYLNLQLRNKSTLLDACAVDTVPDILERLVEVLLVVDLNLQVELVLGMLFRQRQRVAAIASLAAHADGDVHVKVHLSILKQQNPPIR